MNDINLSENLVRLRHAKKLTQEQLADFLGVTKASVSKWETRQSLPDILLLPRLAAFYGVTVDELIGYEPQLSREQIQKLYSELAAGFASRPFDEAVKKTRLLINRYYSCYPFLLQVGILYLNHLDLAEKEQRCEILNEISALCTHIADSCTSADICADAATLKAMTDLQLGKIREVIDSLEPVSDPKRISNSSGSVLIQAYMLSGQKEKALDMCQISMYLGLLTLIGSSVQYLSAAVGELSDCEETIRRTDRLIEAYQLELLHPNSAAQFYYQSALVYAYHECFDAAAERLLKYEKTVRHLLSEDNLKLHGDSYFDRIDKWIEALELGSAPPRNIRAVARSSWEILEEPLFEPLKQNPAFKKILGSLKKEYSRYE